MVQKLEGKTLAAEINTTYKREDLEYRFSEFKSPMERYGIDIADIYKLQYR